jgi:hypothetical protein
MVRRALGVGIGAVLAASAAAIPAPASASGHCDVDAPGSTCEVLDTCYGIGAMNDSLPPADAVAYYRRCLFTDHRYALALTGTGVIAKARRAPLLKIYESTFWPLYCHALQRAGQRDRSICERRSTSTSSRTKRSQRRHHHTHRTAPRFTG